MIWRVDCQPLIISIYLTETELSMAERNKVIAEIGLNMFNSLDLWV
ncbi:ORF12 [Moritella viscosa]|nr:ORF12 [Moritella viscosa]